MPMPTTTPESLPNTPPNPALSRPGEGGFQLSERYKEQLADISTDYSNAIVALSTDVAIKETLASSFAVLDKHDFTSETSAIDSISEEVNGMISEAAAMALEFEALVGALTDLDTYIIDRLTGIMSLTEEQKAEIMDEYNKYKNGECDFSDFLDYLSGLEDSGNIIATLFGISEDRQQDFLTLFAESGKYLGAQWLEQILVENTLATVIEGWGINLVLDTGAYGFSQGLAYAIAGKINNIVQSASSGAAYEYLMEDLAGISGSAFGGFFINAAIIAAVNIGLHAISGDLDPETAFRSVGDGVAIATSAAISEYVVSMLAGSSIPGVGVAFIGAGVVALVYWGGSKAVDYIADQIWSDENMNFDHDRLIEELKENGAALYESVKVDGTGESIFDTYMKMEDDGSPRAFTNYFLGAAGQPYDTTYDGSPEFDAITNILLNPNPAGYVTDEQSVIAAASRYPTQDERQRYIDTYNEVCDYCKTHPTANIETYMIPGASDYVLNGTLSMY